MDRPAASLTSGDHDLAAIGLEHPGRRGGRLGEHRITDAAEEQGDSGPLRPDRREDVREPAPGRGEGRQHGLQVAEGGRQELRQPDLLGQAQSPGLLEPAGRGERGLDPAGVGEEVVEDQPLEQAGPVRGRRRSVEGDLERLDQFAVLDARRAGGLAGPAVEAEVEVVADLGRDADPAVGHRPHQVDPAPGAVVLVASLDVSGATRGAEAAVDAVLEPAVGDLRSQPCQVDPGRGGGRIR